MKIVIDAAAGWPGADRLDDLPAINATTDELTQVSRT